MMSIYGRGRGIAREGARAYLSLGNGQGIGEINKHSLSLELDVFRPLLRNDMGTRVV